jgi:hypothetical protein
MIGYGAVATVRFPRIPPSPVHNSTPGHDVHIRRGSTSSSETDVTESRNSLETDQRRLRRLVRCWPTPTRTSPRFHGVGSTVWVPRRGSRPVTNAELDIATPSHGAVTSGQLGKPNNDTRLPPRTVVQTNKACPEARLFPVTRCMLFGLEGPVNRSAGVMPSTVRPGRFLDDAVLVGTSASTGRHVESVGRRGAGRVLVGGRFLDGAVPRRRGSSTARCWPRTQQHGSPATVAAWSARSASTEEGDSTSDSEIDARPPRIALNASGVDQWAFGQ